MNADESLMDIEEIRNLIYTVRGVQVMLDKDLASFYNVKPIRLREQVKRNIKRFPRDFMFQLTDAEIEIMVSQNAIPSNNLQFSYVTTSYPSHRIAASRSHN